jgi:hypothetical protein
LGDAALLTQIPQLEAGFGFFALVAQRHVLYLGEINDSQRLAWERAITVFDESTGTTQQLALFPVDRLPPAGGPAAVHVCLDSLRLERPRQWGACWLGDELWRTLHLDDFFGARLPVNREGTDWEKVLRILTIYRLLSPGSELAAASSVV